MPNLWDEGETRMARDDGGAACSRCSKPASHRQGHQWLCPKHYRFGQMRVNAKRHGKTVPTHEQLEAMLDPEMRCTDCNTVMSWLARDDRTFVITLQHYRNGTLGLVCRSCNTRHAYMPGDDFCDMPPGYKFCPSCKRQRPFAEFAADLGRSGPMKLKSWCKDCSFAAHTKWRIKNRDYYNAKQRENRARRAATN